MAGQDCRIVVEAEKPGYVGAPHPVFGSIRGTARARVRGEFDG